MNVFYATHIETDRAFLEAAEAHHAVRVLRKQVGDELYWVDGRGYFYRGVIEKVGKNLVELSILTKVLQEVEGEVKLHLAVAPTKNIARFEWLLEKAVEIGVRRITPLLCTHSERKRIRLDRLQKRLISAMKQSGRAYLPVLDDLMPFGKFVRHIATNASEKGQKFIAHCRAQPNREPLQSLYRVGEDAIMLIGPEGDFSTEEIDVAVRFGFLPVTLGSARLRTETAAVATAVWVAMRNA